MFALDAYLEAVAAYRELCIRDGALATAVFNNGLAATKLKARILAFALTDTREDMDGATTENAGRCDELEKQVIECIYTPCQLELDFGDDDAS